MTPILCARLSVASRRFLFLAQIGGCRRDGGRWLLYFELRMLATCRAWWRVVHVLGISEQVDGSSDKMTWPGRAAISNDFNVLSFTVVLQLGQVFRKCLLS